MRAPATLALALCLAACPSPRPADAPKPPAVVGGDVEVTPLVLDDAHRADRALILGTRADGGATVVPLAAGEQKVKVDSLYVSLHPVRGGVDPVILTAGPNLEAQVRVGIFEDVAGGVGPSWRTGVWMASLVAADVLGKDLTDLTFTASASGHVDGASASALVTAGFLAALLGRPIAADATMTGTINPDGSIGPVRGIPQKFTAAIAAGKKRLGYPIGMRMAADLETGEPVDLVELAGAGGAEAIEIADVYGALELLTGTSLPRPVPVDEAAMALPAEVDAALAVQYAHWQSLLAAEWPRVLTLATSRAVPSVVAEVARGAQDDLAAAERLRTAGRGAAALRLLTRAWLQAAGAAATADILDRVKAGDLDGAQAKLTELEALGADTDAALAALGARAPDSMGGHLELVSAFQLAIAGWSFRALAADQHLPAARAAIAALAGQPAGTLASAATADEVARAVLPAIAAIGRAVVGSARAAAALEIEATASIDYRCSLPNVQRLATSFTSAAAANLAYLDALIVAQVAKERGITVDAAREQFAAFDPGYLVALMAANVGGLPGLPAELRAAWGESSIAWGLFQLAAGEVSYERSSGILNEYYTLEAQPGPDGRAATVVHEAAFEHMLVRAERRAREQAHAAQVATGAIPVQTRIHYQIAKSQAAGDLTDRLEALGSYWTAATFAQTAVMLARN